MTIARSQLHDKINQALWKSYILQLHKRKEKPVNGDKVSLYRLYHTGLSLIISPSTVSLPSGVHTIQLHAHSFLTIKLFSYMYMYTIRHMEIQKQNHSYFEHSCNHYTLGWLLEFMKSLPAEGRVMDDSGMIIFCWLSCCRISWGI